MSQKFLNRSDIIICLEQVAGKAVAKRVGRCPFIELQPIDN